MINRSSLAESKVSPLWTDRDSAMWCLFKAAAFPVRAATIPSCSLLTAARLFPIKDNPLLSGLTLSGGEPFTQAAACANLAREVHALGLTVITYTGYVWEELVSSSQSDWRSLIQETDILVDGPYIKELKNIDLTFRGSSNQRLIDVKQSLAAGKVVEIDM